jgi:hypothetical protein
MFGHNDQNNQNGNNGGGYGQPGIIGGLGNPPGMSEPANAVDTQSEALLTEHASDPQTPVSAPIDEPSSISDSNGGGTLSSIAFPISSSTDDTTNELIDLKSKALHQLAPLVDQLDQSPEEKFRTTMMMIQASDNQSLIKDAYEAAQAIPDEKAKAQALLDVVNEINYFTQR